jgi:hypothetical protein
MSEFNPSDPKYKKVENLPKEERNNFVDTESGFVRKEALEELSKAEFEAKIINIFKQEKETSLDTLRYKARLDDLDREYEIKKREYEQAEKVGKVGLRYYASGELSRNPEIIREEVLEAVRRKDDALAYTSDKFRRDEEIVFAAVERNGLALQYAADKLRGNRNIVLRAVKQNPRALQYASDELSGDQEVVLEALKRNPDALQYVSNNLRMKIKEILRPRIG